MIISQLREVFGRKIGIIDDSRYIISQNTPREVENAVDEIADNCPQSGTVYRYAGHTFVSFGKDKTEFIAFCAGEDEAAEKCCRILGVSVGGVKSVYDDKFDRTNFVKNVLLDNILPGDIYAKARELNLLRDTRRVVFDIVKENISTNEFNVRDIVERIYPDKESDFVITIDSGNIVLVKELAAEPFDGELEEIAKTIIDTLQSEAMITVKIGVGRPVNGIRDLAKSYKEAQLALEVALAFDEEKNIIDYANLGIARLIYQLPTTLCEMFLSEIFKDGSIDSLDRETLLTIDKFFENNLNVSETSRQLYVHRNTLVYRLDKVQKLTGFDLRILDHAILFKVAMLVKKYLNSSRKRNEIMM
ncbi:MAG: helix-turn-helix domain-containing protein [Clostridia bacterium]|nr:helix-turn-helix domain-containing protein [Clostridia bacterium]